MKSTLSFAAITLALVASATHAEGVFTHPAVAGSAPLSGAIQAAQARPVIVGHPSSPHWKLVHANAEHPAVAAAARATTPIDANTFIVQPPASVHWTQAPVEPTLVARHDR